MKILSINWQRNSAVADSFYSIIFSDNENKFIGTFTTNEGGTKINIPSCRIIEINNNLGSWRGDEYAYRLQKKLNKIMSKYDMTYIYEIIYIDYTRRFRY